MAGLLAGQFPAGYEACVVTSHSYLPTCGMVWYGMVWYGMVWYGMVLLVYMDMDKEQVVHSMDSVHDGQYFSCPCMDSFLSMHGQCPYGQCPYYGQLSIIYGQLSIDWETVHKLSILWTVSILWTLSIHGQLSIQMLIHGQGGVQSTPDIQENRNQ